MRERPPAPRGKYLYAVIPTPSRLELDPTAGATLECFGIDGSPVYCIRDDGVAAVVSDIGRDRIRPERRHLAAHYDVLRTLMNDKAVLPMTFGIIADGPGAIRKILALNRTSLLDQLRRVARGVEMGLNVVWSVPNIFEYFVNMHPQLRDLRDRIFSRGVMPSQEERIELGRLFCEFLSQDRLRHTDAALQALRPLCREIKQAKPRTEREVMSLACLLDDDAEKTFEEGVYELATHFDDNFTVRFSGPFPPHSFADVPLRI